MFGIQRLALLKLTCKLKCFEACLECSNCSGRYGNGIVLLQTLEPAVKHPSIDTGTDTFRSAGIPADYTTFYFSNVGEQFQGSEAWLYAGLSLVKVQ